jgi:uncharacterized membrane protein
MIDAEANPSYGGGEKRTRHAAGSHYSHIGSYFYLANHNNYKVEKMEKAILFATIVTFFFITFSNNVLATCVRGYPEITDLTGLVFGVPGQSQTFNLTFKNTDSIDCGSSFFLVQLSNCPYDWTCYIMVESALPVEPNETRKVWVTMIPPPDAQVGIYQSTVNITNLNSSYSSSLNVSYFVSVEGRRVLKAGDETNVTTTNTVYELKKWHNFIISEYSMYPRYIIFPVRLSNYSAYKIRICEEPYKRLCSEAEINATSGTGLYYALLDTRHLGKGYYTTEFYLRSLDGRAVWHDIMEMWWVGDTGSRDEYLNYFFSDGKTNNIEYTLVGRYTSVFYNFTIKPNYVNVQAILYNQYGYNTSLRFLIDGCGETTLSTNSSIPTIVEGVINTTNCSEGLYNTTVWLKTSNSTSYAKIDLIQVWHEGNLEDLNGHKHFYVTNQVNVTESSNSYTLKKRHSTVFSNITVKPKYVYVLERSGGVGTPYFNLTIEGCNGTELIGSGVKTGIIDVSNCGEGIYPTKIYMKSNETGYTVWHDIIEEWHVSDNRCGDGICSIYESQYDCPSDCVCTYCSRGKPMIEDLTGVVYGGIFDKRTFNMRFKNTDTFNCSPSNFSITVYGGNMTGDWIVEILAPEVGNIMPNDFVYFNVSLTPKSNVPIGTYYTTIRVTNVNTGLYWEKDITYVVSYQCVRTPPKVETYTPLLTGGVNETKEFLFNFTNLDTVYCNESYFSISAILPSGWGGYIYVPNVSPVQPQETRNFSIFVTPPIDASGGDYTITVNVTNLNSSLYTTKNVTYRVIGCGLAPLLTDIINPISGGPLEEKDAIINLTNIDYHTCPAANYSILVYGGNLTGNWSVSLLVDPSSVPPNTSRNISVRLRPPMDVKIGTYYIILKANNTWSGNYSERNVYYNVVGECGLAPLLSDIENPVSGYPLEEKEAKINMTNQDYYTCPPMNYSVQLYDGNLTGNWSITLLVDPSSISPNESRNVSIRLKPPIDASIGTYYIILKANNTWSGNYSERNVYYNVVGECGLAPEVTNITALEQITYPAEWRNYTFRVKNVDSPYCLPFDFGFQLVSISPPENFSVILIFPDDTKIYPNQSKYYTLMLKSPEYASGTYSASLRFYNNYSNASTYKTAYYIVPCTRGVPEIYDYTGTVQGAPGATREIKMGFNNTDYYCSPSTFQVRVIAPAGWGVNLYIYNVSPVQSGEVRNFSVYLTPPLTVNVSTYPSLVNVTNLASGLGSTRYIYYEVTTALYCGDGICSPEIGETSETCPQDCLPPAPPMSLTVLLGGAFLAFLGILVGIMSNIGV